MSTMTLSQAVALFVASAIFVYLVWNERKAVSKVPLVVRYVASLLALSALLGLFFPLKYPRGWGIPTESGRLVVVTAGTPPSRIEELAKGGKTVTTDTAISAKYQIPLVRDWPAFLAQHPDEPLTVHGFGLTTRQLEAIDGRPLTYHQPPSPQGFVFCEWPQQLQASLPLVVHGQYHNPTGRDVKIILLSASHAVDSVMVPPKGTHPFTLSYQPKQAGNTLFGLAAVDGQDTLHAERVPVSIVPAPTLHVVMLAASPSFEYKFVGDWLRQLHYGVAFRARITKDRFSTAYTEGVPHLLGAPLNESAFKGVDLLIADEAELAALSRSEQLVIAEAVQSGLGLLLFIGDEKSSSLLGREFHHLTAHGKPEQALAVTGADGQQYPVLPAAIVNGIRVSPMQQSLLYSGSQTVAASQLYGSGRITALTLTNSYSWWLRNQQAAYAQFWSYLIDNTTAGRHGLTRYIQAPRYPAAHAWTELLQQHATEKTPTVDGWKYPVIRHEYLPDFFRISFWPHRSGWYPLETPQADTLWLYAFDRTDWTAARAYEIISAMDNYTGKNGERTRGKQDERTEISQKEVPKWLFFVLFLLSSSILWYASREYNQNVI